MSEREETQKEISELQAEKRSIRLNLFFASMAFAAWLFVLMVWVIIPSLMLRLVDSAVVPVSFPVQQVSHLVLSGSGQLTAVVQRASALSVYCWDKSGSIDHTKPVNLGRLSGAKPVPALLSPARLDTQTADQGQNNQLGSGIAYAFSDNAEEIAWVWDGNLFVGPITQPRRQRFPLISSSPALRLSFLGDQFVIVLHADGRAQVYDRSGQVPQDRLPGTRVKGVPGIFGGGLYRVILGFGENEGLLVDSRVVGKPEKPDKQVFQTFPVSPASTHITTSPAGEVTLGTSEGMIFFPKPRGDAKVVPVPDAGSIRAMAYYDTRHVIVGGDGLFLVKDQSDVMRLTPAPRGVRLLTVSGKNIAYTTGASLFRARLQRWPDPGEPEKFFFAVAFSVLALFAFFRVAMLDYWSMKRLTRKLATLVKESKGINGRVEGSEESKLTESQSPSPTAQTAEERDRGGPPDRASLPMEPGSPGEG